jgi:hypothetical protein
VDRPDALVGAGIGPGAIIFLKVRPTRDQASLAVKTLRCDPQAQCPMMAPFASLHPLARDIDASHGLAIWLSQYSQMSKKAKPKKRGRPATGRDPMMGFRAAPVLRAPS